MRASLRRVERNLHLRATMDTAVAPAHLARELRPWVAPIVRLGYVAKGIIYLLIGVLAVRLAFGLEGGRVTDASGALRVLMNQPFGFFLISALGVGILAYAAWQIVEGLLDTRGKGGGARGWTDRALTIVKGAVYGAVGLEALRMVLGIRGSSKDADDYARNVMQVPIVGSWFFALVGVGVGVYGVMQMRKAFRAEFDEDVDAERMRRETGAWTLSLGRIGTAGRGLILTVMGILLARAGFNRSPAEAGGMVDSLWTLMSQPYGTWLFTAAAAGLVCFGIFQLLHWRYARL